MTILIDIDNTINNMNHVLLEELNRRDGTNYAYEDIKTYDWFDETFNDPWEFTNHEWFWYKVQPQKYAIQTINALVKSHTIYFVTASHYNDMLGYKIQSTLAWFNSSCFSTKNVIVCENKDMIKGDLLIDDCTHNLLQFGFSSGTSRKTLCIAQPWNKGLTTRCPKWECIWAHGLKPWIMN